MAVAQGGADPEWVTRTDLSFWQGFIPQGSVPFCSYQPMKNRPGLIGSGELNESEAAYYVNKQREAITKKNETMHKIVIFKLTWDPEFMHECHYMTCLVGKEIKKPVNADAKTGISTVLISAGSNKSVVVDVPAGHSVYYFMMQVLKPFIRHFCDGLKLHTKNLNLVLLKNQKKEIKILYDDLAGKNVSEMLQKLMITSVYDELFIDVYDLAVEQAKEENSHATSGAGATSGAKTATGAAGGVNAAQNQDKDDPGSSTVGQDQEGDSQEFVPQTPEQGLPPNGPEKRARVVSPQPVQECLSGSGKGKEQDFQPSRKPATFNRYGRDRGTWDTNPETGQLNSYTEYPGLPGGMIGPGYFSNETCSQEKFDYAGRTAEEMLYLPTKIMRAEKMFQESGAYLDSGLTKGSPQGYKYCPKCGVLLRLADAVCVVHFNKDGKFMRGCGTMQKAARKKRDLQEKQNAPKAKRRR